MNTEAPRNVLYFRHMLHTLLEWLVPAAQAHEKWFVSDSALYVQPEMYRTVNVVTVTGALIALALVVVGLLVDGRYECSSLYARLEGKIRPYRDYAAGILAVTTGVTLVILTLQGHFLAENFIPLSGKIGRALMMAQGVIGALLVVGLYTAQAAIGLVALFVSAFFWQAPGDVIDYLHFPAIALFLFVFARGRYSLDWFLGKPVFSTPEQRKTVYFVTRLLFGATIIWIAFIKYLDPGLHLALMDKYPSWNPYVIANWLGVHLSRETYVFTLFCIELTVGLFIALGSLTRFMAVFLVPVFMGSIIFLGVGELVGHLPLLGLLAVFFIYGDTYHKNREHDRYAPHPEHQDSISAP